MGSAKKFGTFGGVFTPSILTILGVIMYMRLGWVVGQAGLIAALAVILIAHIISISTGLSIASIATDKTVKTGGIYYILSRSLGLPMGGAIGLTLFIGTALSISLYLIGFAESFLSVESIRNTLGLAQNTNGFRIIGSIFLMLLVIIAFVSTSLAIKSQYFILGAIFLSLISIIVGFFIHPEFQPEQITMSAPKDGVSLAVIFGIFFPAVTGFTAGVAMSGDLKDPKKGIPVGTIGAIGVGLIVYVGLAIMFAVFVKPDLLINDYNFLMKVAWISPLVLAGIWGATLSSGLGGILGGPRILQAIAKDKMAPRIFAKGFGPSNEPRNALILTFLIAEGGILIGELNVIAGVVSMFYLASYGFINLAFFLEKWASTDFRPAFKISKYTGLLGFTASFIVMSQLDMLSMVAALVIMLGLYFLLSRKQLQQDSGDVWQSVWLSIVRLALHRMDKKEIEERNWQPNILMFSGGTSRRPHIIEFGKNLVGRYGMLSNFDLHESKEQKYLFPKHLQSLPFDEINSKGVFTRQQTCSDLYLGIETIVSTYGFSGIEPNTALMGWARETTNPERFVKMVQRLYELDVNLLMIDYDKRYGYGKYESIDVWWRGEGHHGNLSLILTRFLWSSKQWRDARLRLLIVNPVNQDAVRIRQKAETLLENMRIQAEVKIINNQIEQKPFYDLMRIESLKTDLILMGLPDIEAGKETEFVEETSALMLDIGTVVLVKASSQFKSLHIGLKETELKSDEQRALNFVVSQNDALIDPTMPDNVQAAKDLKQIHQKLAQADADFLNNAMRGMLTENNDLSDLIAELQEKVNSGQDILTDADLNKTLQEAIRKISIKIKEAETQNPSRLKEHIDNYMTECEEIVRNLPQYQFYSYGKQDLSILEEDSKTTKRFKKKKEIRLKLTKKPVRYKVRFKALMAGYFPIEPYNSLLALISNYQMVALQYNIEQELVLQKYRDAVISGRMQNGETKEFTQLKNQLENYQELEKVAFGKLVEALQNKTNSLINNIGTDLLQIDVNNLIKRTKNRNKTLKNLKQSLLDVPEMHAKNRILFKNAFLLELYLLDFETKLHRIIQESLNELRTAIETAGLNEAREIVKVLKDYAETAQIRNNLQFNSRQPAEIADEENLFAAFKSIFEQRFDRLKQSTSTLPDELEIIPQDKFNELNDNPFQEIETLTIAPRTLIDFIIQNEIFAPLLRLIDPLPGKIRQKTETVQNIFRLVRFSYFDNKGAVLKPDEHDRDTILTFVEKQIAKAEIALTDFEQTATETEHQIMERISALSGNLNTQILSKYADGSLRLVKRIKNERRIKKAYKSTVNAISDQTNRLWYRHSEAILLKQRMDETQDQTPTRVKRLLDLRETVCPNPELLKNLPFYYRQLFLRDHNYNPEFWFGRKYESEQFKKAVNRYQSGFSGGILITGERFSGKTFLARHSIETYLPGRKIINVEFPENGKLDETTFLQAVADAAEFRGNIKYIFERIPGGNIIFIDDLEQWWHKSADGFAVINLLTKLIQTHGNKLLFVVNINRFSFEVINKIKPIDSYFLDIIDCKPFSAEQLNEAIMFRHKAGGLKIRFKNKIEPNIARMDFARLFAKYFNYSDGNIGISLLSWPSNITDIEGDTIQIRSPKQPNTESEFFEDTDMAIVMLQLLLHKAIDAPTLKKVSMLNRETLEKKLDFALRAGLIDKNLSNKYSINAYMYKIVFSKLSEADMI